MKDIYDIKNDKYKRIKLQSFYNVLSTDRIDLVATNILDVDYDTEDHNQQNKDDIYNYEIKLINKKILLKKEWIEIKNNDIISSVEEFLFEKFIELADNEGHKNEIHEIDYKDYKNKEISFNKIILSRLVLMKHYIQSNGRIGTGNFIISNEKTNNFLIECEDTKIQEHFKFLVYKNLEDGKIIMGRKNDFSQPGIILILNENSLSNIVYKDNKKYVNLIYSFSSEGLKPEKQYLIMKIKNKF